MLNYMIKMNSFYNTIRLNAMCMLRGEHTKIYFFAVLQNNCHTECLLWIVRN